MSLNRCSRSAILVVAVVALVATASVGAAVTVADTSVPEDGEVGETVTASVEIEALYDDHEDWQIAATTELEDAEWTAELRSDGDVIDDRSNDGDTLDAIALDENASDAPDSLWIEVEGEVPEVETFSYEDGQPVPVIEVLGHDGDREFEIDSWSIDRYTTGNPGSSEARTALDDASAAIDAADDDGQDVTEAEERFAEGVDHYDDGAFADAVEAADDVHALLGTDDAGDEDADDAAEETDDETSDADGDEVDQPAGADDEDGGIGILTILLYGLGFVALVAAGGGVLYVRQQRDRPSRDPLG